MPRRIWVMLCLKTKRSVFGVFESAFPLLDGIEHHVVAAIKVDCGFGGEHFQTNAGSVASAVSDVLQFVFRANDDQVVVIARADSELAIIIVESFAERMLASKIQRGVVDGDDSSGLRKIVIVFGVVTAV